MKVKRMRFREFMDSLDQDKSPGGLEPCLRALWYDSQGAWDTAREIVQQVDDVSASPIHAYLHCKGGSDWNARYWHRRAGSVFPENTSLKEGFNSLLREIVG